MGRALELAGDLDFLAPRGLVEGLDSVEVKASEWTEAQVVHLEAKVSRWEPGRATAVPW